MEFVSPLAPVIPNYRESRLIWSQLYGSSRALAITRAAQANRGPLIIVTSDARQAQRLESEICFFDKQLTDPILSFPDWECLPYDVFSPHQDICSQRLRTLSLAPSLQRGIIVIAVSNLMQRLPPKEYVFAHSFVLKIGDRLDIAELRSRLQQTAYQHVSQVMAPGEFAVRGGLVDIFPMGSSRPFRVDLFDDQIDSIRYFDPDTQRSQDQEQEINLLPAREFPMTPDGIKRFRQSFRNKFEGDPQKYSVYVDVSNGITPAGVEFYFPLFFEKTATFFDYVPPSSLCVLLDDVTDVSHKFGNEVQDRFELARLDPDRPALRPDALFMTTEQVMSALDSFRRIDIRARDTERSDTSVTFGTAPPVELPVDTKSDSPYQTFLQYLDEFTGRILLVAETPGRQEVMLGVLQEHGLKPTTLSSWESFLDQTGTKLGITTSELDRGLVLQDPKVAVITESQLYGDKVFQRYRRRSKIRDAESIIHSLAELKIGDPVVHEEHGVGRYLGLRVLGINGQETEFLALEYQGGDKLYIPVLSLHLISRYIGGSPEHAPLHKLGSDAWSREKKRAQEKAYDVAAELLEIEAMRRGRQGHAFAMPHEAYTVFAAEFPFEETPDQSQVIEDVINDLTSSKPMDRLVCGDVGFGKTEVALRASFLAVKAGKQVAVLVPTTLLAQQHFQNFRDRFAGLDTRVELLSRFRTKKETEMLLDDLEQGNIEIVIGTHRLLQPDVNFNKLGLLILDEEHRFGVRQKEKIKRLRNEVDILTLTATPIPRTLNMAMAGLRSISIIATPPPERLSIKTFVRQWNNGLIREACLREIHRGGQVYFLHNDVKTIDRIAADLRKLVPEATIEIAHGQM
ncbi:MAG: DEAD/DEAH box helicase, partial [Gammaproteobacteria bacterium]|nr:DEAD/DEAH box helicase [Gammaproteobacteria bacterium]